MVLKLDKYRFFPDNKNAFQKPSNSTFIGLYHISFTNQLIVNIMNYFAKSKSEISSSDTSK